MMDIDTPIGPVLVDRARIDRAKLVAGAVAMLFVFLTVAASIYGLINVNQSLSRQLDDAATKIAAGQAETECVRELSGKKSRADTQYATANGALIIAVAVRGDVGQALTDLDTRKVELTAADDAYYLATTEGVVPERDCPAG